MREIKFRAYDKKHKRMIDGWDLEYLNEIFESKKDGIFVIGEDLELMQYTGLKDKNEKEIYEGDIIKSEVKITREDVVTKIKEKILETDIWSIDMSQLNWFTSPKGHAFDNSWISFEVIGNIYENPDLLEANGTEE